MVSVTVIFRIRLAGAGMAAGVATITNRTTISTRVAGDVHMIQDDGKTAYSLLRENEALVSSILTFAMPLPLV